MSVPPSASGYSHNPSTQQRPTSATVFAILHFVFGSLAACGVLWAIITLVAPSVASFGQPNPIMDDMMTDSTAVAVNWIANLWGVLTLVLMFAGGAGLLAVKPYGRTCSIYYALSSLGEKVFGVATYFFVQMPLIERSLDNLRDDPNADQNLVRGMELGMSIGHFTAIIGVLILAIYPILVLIYMNRRPILERYKPGYVGAQDFSSAGPQTLPANYQPPDENNPYSSPFDPKT